MNKIAIGGSVAAAIIIVAAVAFLASGNNSASQNATVQSHPSIDLSMGSHIQGSANAPITIVEFGDYQCEKCDQWFKTVRPSVEDNYIKTGKANLVFVDLPIVGPDSIPAAQASYCAEDQGKYWEYHNALYTDQGAENSGWASPTNLKGFASKIGLDMNQFNSCLDSGKYQKRVDHNLQVAKTAGATGTPTFVIFNAKGEQKTIAGPQAYSVFQQTLESMT